jgi:YidC/Oxa1 family membrane protein insertase
MRGVDVKASYEPWLPVDLMQTLLVDVHEAAGCSWFAAIVLAVIGIRVVTLPVSIAAIRGSREKAILQPQFNELMEKQKALNMEGDQEKVAEVSRKLQAFQQKHGRFFMLKGTWNLLCFQMPLYITAFASMRGFAGHPDLFKGFAMEAPLWLDSLALPDPYALMPLFTAAIMLTNTEVFGSIDTEVQAAAPTETQKADSQVGGQSTFQKYQKWIMRGSSVMFVPLTWNFPAGVFVFMSTNLIVAVAQNKILRLPVLERLLEIPPTVEAIAAANAAASSAAPGPLTPLLSTYRRNGIAHSTPVLDGLSAPLSSELIASAKLRNIERASRSDEKTSLSDREEAPIRRSLNDLQVNPGFAVRRARPLRPGLE